MKSMQSIVSLVLLAITVVGCQPGNSKETVEQVPVESNQEVSSATMVGEGQAMEASFKNIRGESVSLADLKGKVVVMNFWATWCPPCIAEMPSLQELHEELKEEENIVFMAIDVDGDIDRAAQFMAKKKYTLPLYTIDSQLPAELMSNSIPMTVILAKNGDIVGKQVGMMDFKSEKLKKGLVELTKENNRE